MKNFAKGYKLTNRKHSKFLKDDKVYYFLTSAQLKTLKREYIEHRWKFPEIEFYSTFVVYQFQNYSFIKNLLYYLKCFVSGKIFSEDTPSNIFNGRLIDFNYLRHVSRFQFLKIILFDNFKCFLTFKSIQTILFGKRISKHLYLNHDMITCINEKYETVMEFSKDFETLNILGVVPNCVINEILEYLNK